MYSSKPFIISPLQSDLLDFSRWAAAFLVVIEHTRSFMFGNYGTVGRMEVWWKLFYFLTDFGHSAVMIFFVMSGFLVGGKVLERLLLGNFEWLKYAVDRVSRLYAVYLLALLVGGGLDYWGYHSFNSFGLYNATFSGHIAAINNHNFIQRLTIPIFFKNLIMCQTILGPVFGSNGPLWSLANEFWYYLAGPLLFGLVIWKTNGPRIFAVAGLALILWFLPTEILIYALVWLLGAALYFINGRAWLPIWIPLILFTASFSVSCLQWIKIPYLADFLIGISFAALINSATGSARRFPGNHWSKMAAGFSYSVYLCHFPILVFILSALFQRGWIGFPGQPTSKLAVAFALVLLLVYVWCFLISLVTERQTSRIRRWLNGLIFGKSAVVGNCSKVVR